MVEMASAFRGQFLIAPADSAIPRHFHRHDLPFGLHLATHADQCVARLRVGSDDVGYVLGEAIDLTCERFVEQVLTLEKLPPPVDAAAIADLAMERLAGSFALIVTHGETAQFLCDASATLGCVFDPAQRKAGSTADLVLGADYRKRMRPDLVKAFGARADGWFTAGLTAHDGLWRLLPNHRLDLCDFTAQRCWPGTMPSYSETPTHVSQQIATEVAATSRAIATQRDALQTLTGGNETRALLACNRELVGRLTFVTLATPATGRDVHLARRLARFVKARHTIVQGVRANAAQSARWVRAAGDAQAGMNSIWHPSLASLDGQVLIGGLGGEIGRGFLWPRDLSADTCIDASYLLNRLKLPPHRLLLEALERWLAGLPPGCDPWQVLDLAYLELRNGPWAFGQAPLPRGPRDLHPLISRRQVRRMWSLPPGFRRDPGFLRSIVIDNWPQLLAIPINRYGDWRDWLAPVAKLARKPGGGWRKAKQWMRQRRLVRR